MQTMKNWKAVVVEDTYDDVQLVSAILNFNGVEVHLAHNGREGLELVRQEMPTVIITDIAMPEMNGWEMLKALRADARTANIPVIAVSAYYSTEMAEDARIAGFDACFAKPVSARDFVSQVEKVVEN